MIGICPLCRRSSPSSPVECGVVPCAGGIQQRKVPSAVVRASCGVIYTICVVSAKVFWCRTSQLFIYIYIHGAVEESMLFATTDRVAHGRSEDRWGCHKLVCVSDGMEGFRIRCSAAPTKTFLLFYVEKGT